MAADSRARSWVAITLAVEVPDRVVASSAVIIPADKLQIPAGQRHRLLEAYVVGLVGALPDWLVLEDQL